MFLTAFVFRPSLAETVNTSNSRLQRQLFKGLNKAEESGTNPARGSHVQTPEQRQRQQNHDQVQTPNKLTCNLPLSFPPHYHLRPYHRQYTGRTVTRGTLVKGVNMHAMWCSAERRTAACHEGDSVCVFPPQNRMHLPPALRSCPYMRTPQSKAGRCLYASLHFLPL